MNPSTQLDRWHAYAQEAFDTQDISIVFNVLVRYHHAAPEIAAVVRAAEHCPDAREAVEALKRKLAGMDLGAALPL